MLRSVMYYDWKKNSGLQLFRNKFKGLATTFSCARPKTTALFITVLLYFSCILFIFQSGLSVLRHFSASCISRNNNTFLPTYWPRECVHNVWSLRTWLRRSICLWERLEAQGVSPVIPDASARTRKHGRRWLWRDHTSRWLHQPLNLCLQEYKTHGHELHLQKGLM